MKTNKRLRLKDYLPYPSSLSQRQGQLWLAQRRDPISYQGPSGISFPILPLQFFAVRYEEDIVIETNHPGWSMHEFARIKVAGKELWLAKDSDAEGVQTISCNLENIHQWAAEIPVPRRLTPVEVEDRSTDKKLDITLHYQNPLLENVVAQFSSPRPPAPNPLSNGSSFNHSSQFVSVLLDIPGKQIFNTRARMSFNGVDYGLRKIGGLIPVKALLNQTQGGVALSSFTQHFIAPGQFQLTRPIAGTPNWNTQGSEVWAQISNNHGQKKTTYFSENSINRWEYDFTENQFIGARVFCLGEQSPLLDFYLSAELPDFSRAFAGVVTRHFVMKINGKIQGHGQLQATNPGPGKGQLKFLPIAPFWFAERTMISSLTVRGEERMADIRGQMTGRDHRL